MEASEETHSREAENHHFLGYKFNMVVIFIEVSGEITEVSPDLKTGNNLFIYRIRTLGQIFASRGKSAYRQYKTMPQNPGRISFCIEACKRLWGF